MVPCVKFSCASNEHTLENFRPRKEATPLHFLSCLLETELKYWRQPVNLLYSSIYYDTNIPLFQATESCVLIMPGFGFYIFSDFLEH